MMMPRAQNFNQPQYMYGNERQYDGEEEYGEDDDMYDPEDEGEDMGPGRAAGRMLSTA